MAGGAHSCGLALYKPAAVINNDAAALYRPPLALNSGRSLINDSRLPINLLLMALL